MVLISYFNHTDALFNLNGTALYIVDDGKVTFEKGYPTTVPNDRIVLKIERGSSNYTITSFSNIIYKNKEGNWSIWKIMKSKNI